MMSSILRHVSHVPITVFGCVFLCSSMAVSAQHVLNRIEVAAQTNVEIRIDRDAGSALVLQHQQFEQKFPKGSRVYYIDQYLVEDGDAGVVFPVESLFSRDRSGLARVELGFRNEMDVLFPRCHYATDERFRKGFASRRSS